MASCVHWQVPVQGQSAELMKSSSDKEEPNNPGIQLFVLKKKNCHRIKLVIIQWMQHLRSDSFKEAKMTEFQINNNNT